MSHLPHTITTVANRKYRTAHGLVSCGRQKQIEAYDKEGNQHLVFTVDIRAHSPGELMR